ncbi:MAG: hypothetical protein IPQ05_21395 [Leptospiraceae bacterium]|nr:hypothetical protein [Leptospiraceae bacterium]MBK7055676.1 hypothetical protein [Leptospiraceae bacterium]MBL0266345.1 hypothetical protein [Leptospiraceae bacterium]
MADIQITDPDTIRDIIYESSRLRFLLAETFRLPLEEISAIRLDSDNFKIDIYTKVTYFRFKPKGLENILVTNPETRAMELQFDPALAQAVYRIIEEFIQVTGAA